MEERMEKKDEEIQEKVQKVLPQISWTVSLKTQKCIIIILSQSHFYYSPPHTHQINLQFFLTFCVIIYYGLPKLFKEPKIDSHSVLFFE